MNIHDYDHEPGALQTPRTFRRATGAHAILILLLGADMVETLLLVLIGALAGPPVYWLVRATTSWMHTSLIGDIVLVVALALLAYAIIDKFVNDCIRKESQRDNQNDVTNQTGMHPGGRGTHQPIHWGTSECPDEHEQQSLYHIGTQEQDKDGVCSCRTSECARRLEGARFVIIVMYVHVSLLLL